MSTINFVLRTDKELIKTGDHPIHLVFTMSGERRYFNTGKKCYKENWVEKFPHVEYVKDGKLKKSEVTAIANELSKLKTKVEDIERLFQLNETDYNGDSVINKLKEAKGKAGKRTFANVYDFIDEYINLNSTTRVKGSLSVYKSLKTHLKFFEDFTGRKVTFENIDHDFFQQFQNFLVDKEIKKGDKVIKQKVNNITAAKRLSTLKTFLNYAKNKGIKVSDRYNSFKIKQEDLEVIALTQSEFKRIIDLDLSNNKALDQVRDVFCFSCVTGLRYSDLKQLKREHIKADEIKLTIYKTKEQGSVPLIPYSRAIINKYKDLHRPLPVISNQKMNEHLKTLGKMAEINDRIEIVRFFGKNRIAEEYYKYELIGVHTGRKTFVTNSLERGMSLQDVASITGHRSMKSLMRYVKVTEDRKKQVMNSSWGDLLTPNNLRVA